MSERYDARAVEARWQAAWEEAGLFRAVRSGTRPTYYVLEMFPYPSGRIHMGHVRNYTMGDVVARYKRARGYDVLHPMGWDAFGLPAENAAFERGVHPAAWTYGNIATMRGQLQMMGLSIDWEREFATCHPGYYAHQQALFLDFFEAGLVERKEAWVNWDPVDRTVLANEQVVDGRGWRSGAPVEKRRLAQWFLRITRYADELLEALEALPRWPEKVRLMQRNWIGRSEGARILFPIADRDEALEVFTTRPDTLFGASFCALSPNHPLATSLAGADPALAAFIDECNLAGIGERDIEAAGKRGFDTGVRVGHPLAAGRTLPLYVANFVLMDYGTGAIFGCPAHDQRDLEFARAQGLPVIPVVCPPGAEDDDVEIGDEAYTGDGTAINSDFLNGLAVAEAKARAIEALAARGFGGGSVSYRLRDWGISRQRYWGCPIPMVHCESCGVVPVPRAQLPVHLPEDVTFDTPGNPLDPPSDVEAYRLFPLQRCGAEKHGHDGHLRGFVLVLRALLRGPRRYAAAGGRGRAVAAGRSVYRRHRARGAAPSLFPLLHQGAQALRPSRHRRALRRPLHPGHGVPRGPTATKTAAGTTRTRSSAAPAAWWRGTTGARSRPAARRR